MMKVFIDTNVVESEKKRVFTHSLSFCYGQQVELIAEGDQHRAVGLWALTMG